MIDAAVRKALQSTMDPQTEAVTWMNIEQASEYLNLAVQTIYQKVSGLDIPFHKKGKKLWFLKCDLDEWLKEGRQKTRQEIEKDVKHGRL